MDINDINISRNHGALGGEVVVGLDGGLELANGDDFMNQMDVHTIKNLKFTSGKKSQLGIRSEMADLNTEKIGGGGLAARSQSQKSSHFST